MDLFKKIFQLQNDEESKSKHKKMINYDNNEKYEGQTNKQGARHGQGMMHYNNGDKYEGEWYNNLRQGQGKQYYYNGDFYTGSWNKDKKEGHGQYFYSNNERYEGDWNNDLRHGKGKYFYRNGDIYDGSWVKGKKEGKGRMTYYNNEEYDGDWLNDKKHIKNSGQNNESKEDNNHKRRKIGQEDNSNTNSYEEKNSLDQVRKVNSNGSDRKNSSPKNKKSIQDDKDYEYDYNKASSNNIKEEIQNNLFSNNQINSNILESQQLQYTNQYHSNRDNDFAIATNVEESVSKSNIIATEVNDTYRTNGQSLQISIDDNKAIDILDIMESYEILNNFPQDLREWNTGHICKWLDSIGLGEYSPSFESNQICGQSICMLTEQELEQSIGMKALGKRKIFLKYQEMLKKYYNKKLSKDIKQFIYKHQSRFKKGEKSLTFLKQNQQNYRSIREEDESISSHKNSLNSNQINQMENFMLLEEDEDEDHSGGKKQKDKDKKNNSYRNSDEEQNKEKNENNKKNQKIKKKKRDKGSNNSSSNDESDYSLSDNQKVNALRSRENSGSNLVIAKDDQKEKKQKRNSPQYQYINNNLEENHKHKQKDKSKNFAGDEDEEIHKFLKFQKNKSQTEQQKSHNNHLSKVQSDSTYNSHRLKIQQMNNVYSEDKLFQDIKVEKKQNHKQSSDYLQNNNSESVLTEQIQELANSISNGNCQNQDIQTAQELNQNNTLEDDIKNQKQLSKEINKTQSLDNSYVKKKKKDDKFVIRDGKFNNNSIDSLDTQEQKQHKSDDAISVNQMNSPEIKQNELIKSLQPDFINAKPFILNFNQSLNQNENTLFKLGIQKDLFVSEKNDSQKTGLTKITSSNQSGGQTLVNQSSGAIGNPTTQNSSVENNSGQNKGIQISNNQLSSSSSSSDESSDNEPNKQVVNKRSKGDGGASISSQDTDTNSKIKQRQTPQQKFKKENTKDGSRNPSKDKATPQIKHKDKDKMKEISKEKSRLRREEKQQQLDQLLRDMGINKKLIINYQELDFGKKIGEGSYGQVFKGTWAKTQVAIKQFGKQNSKFHLRKVQDFISEVRVINNLRHPNIVLYMGVCFYQSQYFMITEYLQEGSLYDHLHIKHTAFSEAKQIDMIEDMALGMVYLHGRKVMHCDLKSSNVLIDENWNVKLCDFGLSRIKSTLNKKKNARKNEGLIGTPQWMAPEIMRREQYQEHSDVYSFGMIMWEIATRKVPYLGLSHQQIYGTVGYDENYQVEVPKRGIPRYLNLMKKCLRRNPQERPTFQEVVEEILLIKKDLKDNNKKQVVKEIIRFFD
ncbi:hypothetical protein ABPG74_021582 [Tetrahymena malaccensis]